MLRRGLRVLGALVSLALLVGMGYFHYSYSSLDHGLHRVAVGGLGSAPSGGPSGIAHIDGQAQNLLIIGNDSRAGLSSAEIKKLHVGSADATTSTDTLMVVHVPADGSKATLISIPRDSYVDIPGFQKNKINAAYADGYTYGTDGYPVTSSSTDEQRQAAGLTLLITVIKNLTGLTINHYVMVNFLGFYNIAKAIHGISVNLCHAVDDTVAHNAAEGGDGGSGFVMAGGRHTLDPVQSLEFVRQRHNLVDAKGNQLNDIGREARQRYFLAAAFDRIESAGTLLDPGELSSLIKAIDSTLTLDSGLSLTDFAHQMIDLTGGNIVGQTIPTSGGQNVGGSVGDVVTVDKAEVQAAIAKWLAPKASTPKAPSSSSSSGTPSSGSTSRSSSVPQADSGACIN